MTKISLIVLIFCAAAWGQDLQAQREAQQARLEKLRLEIAAVEKKIAHAGAEEQKLIELLDNLEEKLSLRKRLIKELDNDRDLTERELLNAQNKLVQVRRDIQTMDADIDLKLKEIGSLKTKVIKRALYTYKKMKFDELRLILMSGSINQALVRRKYFDAMTVHDKKILQELHSRKLELAEKRAFKLSLEATLVSAEQEMKDRLEYKRELIDEAKNEEKKLKSDKNRKEKLLQKLKHDKSEYEQQLSAKRAAAAEIEKLIASLIEKAAAALEVAKMFPDLDFKALKGKMDWPAVGKIVSGFGSHLNPKFNTKTENTGVDIQTEKGAKVKVVAAGKVTVVTWLRGYGTTMIVNHPGDYYTVYANIDEVMASPGSMVKSGAVIGTAADDEEKGKSRLHFELWEKRTKQDPELWLK